MTMANTIDFLDAVKAYYPAAYRNYTPQEAKAVCVVWQDAFADVPLDIMMQALRLHAQKQKYAPSVSEIRDSLASIHMSVCDFLSYPPFLRAVSAEEIARRKRIRDLTAPFAAKAKADDCLHLSPREQRLLDSVEF